MEPLGCAFDFVIVDDDSPDETRDVASQHADRYPVRVIPRHGERGLATAVLSGIRAAKHDIIVVMNADLEHAPEKMPDLISRFGIATSSYVNGACQDTSFFGLARRYAACNCWQYTTDFHGTKL